jgi:hypothetical protein
MKEKIKTILNNSIIKTPTKEILAWRAQLKKDFCMYRNNDVYNRVLPRPEGNALISELIRGDRPMAISRFGGVELRCVVQYLHGEKYSDFSIYKMINNAGFFMSDTKELDQYCELFLESARQVDLLGVWFHNDEVEIIKKCCPKADLVRLLTIQPYYHQNPWSKNLEGKKVLVIHPFSKTITEQYNKHQEVLFQDKNVLPKFELMTLKAVQSIGGTKTEFKTWFDAYYWMQDRIREYDFDIAIIGCGGYGLPLAAYVKSLGKKAIHLGGATQILFGIRGKRWDERPFVESLYNQYWGRPSVEETPQTNEKIEDGCYW